MKKKLFFLAVSFLALACSKQPTSGPVPSRLPDIVAEIVDNDATKTGYLPDENGNPDTKFTWIAGDAIAVLMEDNSTVTYTTSSSGRTVTFTPEISGENYLLGNFAYYPADGLSIIDGEYYASIGLGYNTPDDALSRVPLSGFIRSSYFGGNPPAYVFRTATAILRIDITNIPLNVGMVRIFVSHPDYPLSGLFRIDEDGIIRAENVESLYSGNYGVSVYADWDSTTKTIYLPVPVGTMPGGLKIEVKDYLENNLLSYTSTQPIALEAGHGYQLGTLPSHDIISGLIIEPAGTPPLKDGINVSLPDGIQYIEVMLEESHGQSTILLPENSDAWNSACQRIDASGTFPIDLPPYENIVGNRPSNCQYRILYKAYYEDGFVLSSIVPGDLIQISEELYSDLDLTWSNVDLGGIITY